MPVKDYSTNPDDNLQINGINIAEGMPPGLVNNAIRQMMADVKSNSTDLENGKLSSAGGVMSGSIKINDPANDIAVAPPANTERGMFLADKNGVVMGGFDVIQRASDNAKWTQIFAKNSKGQFTTLSIDIKENGEGEVNSTSPIQINDVRIGRLFANNVRLITLSGARGNEGLSMRYSPDSGELYMDGRAMHGKADAAGYADTAGSANTLGGKAESALSVAFASEAQNAYGVRGVELIIFDYPNTQTLPGYGTWKVNYTTVGPGYVYNIIVNTVPGGTVLSLDREAGAARGIAIRTA